MLFSLQDCDIPNQSVIHAVRARGGAISVEAQIARPLARVTLNAEDANGAVASPGLDSAINYLPVCKLFTLQVYIPLSVHSFET